MGVHGQREELSERAKRGEEQDDSAAALAVSIVRASRFGVRPSKSCDALSVGITSAAEAERGEENVQGLYLENTHAVCVAEDLVRVRIVAVPNVGRCDEQGERIVILWVQQAPLCHLFNLPHPLLLVAACIIFYVLPFPTPRHEQMSLYVLLAEFRAHCLQSRPGSQHFVICSVQPSRIFMCDIMSHLLKCRSFL